MEDNEIILEFKKEKKILTINFMILTIVVALIAALVASEYTAYYYKKNSKLNMLEKTEASANSNQNIDVISKTLKNFRKVIDEYYIGEIDEQKILDETIKGYVKGLNDEYSEYMTADEWKEFQASALGNYVGIGIYMTVDKNGNVVVLAPIEGTPAKKAGIEPGDVIVKVNDESVLGMTSDIVSSKIQGVEGTDVKVTVARETEYIDFNMKRESIKVYHVENKMLENNIGYISLFTFDEGCANEFKEAYQKLKKQGAQKIIIDLRNNTGGIVDEALSIADMIVPKGQKLMITIDSKENKQINYSNNDPIINENIIVLVNEYSASASEILVGALRDNKRATIVGTKTYGKGVIQNVIALNDESVLKLTVNEYLTPNETKINKIGLEPEYIIEANDETEEDEQLNKAIELLK